MHEVLRAIDDKYRERAFTDPEFHNRIKVAERVLEDLDKAGALTGNKSYAAYLVIASLEATAAPGPGEEQAWNMGFTAATREWLAQRANPDHPITRDNPYKRKP